MAKKKKVYNLSEEESLAFFKKDILLSLSLTLFILLLQFSLYFLKIF